ARHWPCFGTKIRNRQVLHAHLKIKIARALTVGESKLIAGPAKVGAAARIAVPIIGGREHACDGWIANVQSLKTDELKGNLRIGINRPSASVTYIIDRKRVNGSRLHGCGGEHDGI